MSTSQVVEIEKLNERDNNGCTKDGTVDRHGKPALRKKSGGWRCGMIILVNQGLVALAFTGVEVNMVLFSKSVLRKSNGEAAYTFSTWMGTTYLFSLMGAFLSDSYLGRFHTCLTFQLIFIIGLLTLSLSTQHFLLKPEGCGTIAALCEPHTSIEGAIFYLSAYLIALGNGAPEPSLVTLGADQFDEEDPKEKQFKTSFYGYFYVALNLGSLVAETALAYIENTGHWIWGFWICACCSFCAYVLLLCGVSRYRRFKPSGNPISRLCQVIVASIRNIKLQVPSNGEDLHEVYARESETSGSRRILHSNDFKFLDKAAIINPQGLILGENGQALNPWRVCTVTQVEEVKCILRILPIWFCTLMPSVVFIQVLSLFVEQGAAMDTTIYGFHFPPASMTAFDIVTTSIFIICYDKLIRPFFIKFTKIEPKPPSELQRIGMGLVIAIVGMVTAGIVELQRRRFAVDCTKETSSLNIFWQTPQYVLVGIAEALVYVAQMEFFASQTPNALKSLGLSLSMSSMAIGSYISSVILTAVMKITTKNRSWGWIPPNLNHGNLERFFFLIAALTTLNLALFIVCAKRYKSTSFEKRDTEG